MSMDHNGEPVWFIKVRDTIYGPYDRERMRTFATEGRLSGRSQIGTDRDGPFGAAGEDAMLVDCFTPAGTGHSESAAPSQTRRFVIFARICDDSRGSFMESLSSFGVAIEAMPDVWLLNAQTRASTLRNAMSHVLGSEDSLFVADASKGVSAWFNLGQDTDKRIRQFWQESES